MSAYMHGGMTLWLLRATDDAKIEIRYIFKHKMCLKIDIFMPPSKKEGHIALHMSVGMSVSLNIVQLINQERFALEASNLVGR